MTDMKRYDGLRVVEHVVQPRQTLSGIAAIYRLRAWEPIAAYNTRVVRLLDGGAPERLPAGRRILIPRSVKGYERWESSLKRLIAELEGFEMSEHASLDATLSRKQAFDVGLNLAGDIATLLPSLAIKAGEAAKAAGAAFDAAHQGEATLNALRFSWAHVESYLDETEGLLGKLGAQAEAAQKAWRKAGLDKLADKTVKAVLGKEAETLVKLVRGTLREKSVGARLAAGARALAEYADWMTPAKLANAYVAAVAGESVADTVAAQKRLTSEAVARHKAHLGAKIKSVQAERKLVWDT
jgi:hypothetical protein